MRRLQSVAAVGILAALAILASGCNKLKARDDLNKGVNSFSAGQYTAASDSFKEAIQLDPDLPSARLYLATAYMMQYVPGSEAPENKRNADTAVKEFQNALNANLDHKNQLVAMQSLASLYLNMKNLPDAEKWYKKVIETDPQNKDAYYALGLIAWTQFVTPWREAIAAQGLKPEDPGPLKPPAPAKGKKKGEPETDLKADLKAKYLPTLNEGIENEKKALQIDPDYENAMTFMNLLTRYRAILDDTKEQYDADMKTADDWLQKSLETQKRKAKKKAQSEQGGQ
ncbi:MAG TPA: tetratricopeptide repeat protein [Bryobacteraceae bacterium]|nr:tetratricopeptide repeat protein [Bryobacteraceae bacterium]